MNRTLLAWTLALLTACSAAAAMDYDVDIQNAANLENVPGADISPPQIPDFDASDISSLDKVWIVNGGAAAKNVTAGGFTVSGGGELNIGFDSSSAVTAGNITINLTDGLDAGNFVIGDSSGSAAVNIGSSSLDKTIAVTGGLLQITDGTVNLDSGSSGAVSLTFTGMVFDKGTLIMTGSAVTLQISGSAVIGNGTDSGDTAVLTATSGASFARGLTIAQGGTLRAGDSITSIAFGASSNQQLILAGGTADANGNTLRLSTNNIVVNAVEGAVSTIDASGGAVSFAANAVMTVRGDLNITGADTGIALGTYRQSAGDVAVTGTQGLIVAEKGEITGGSFKADAGTFTDGLDVTGGAHLLDGSLDFGTGSSLRIGRTAFLDLSDGDLTITGGAATEIYGTMLVGENAGQANRLIAQDPDATVTLYESTVIELTEDFINLLDGTNYLGDVIIQVSPGGEIFLPNGVSRLEFDDFLYGSYTYALDGSGDLILDAYDLGVSRDGTEADFRKAEEMIIRKYGRLFGKSGGFPENIYKSAVREDALGVPPYDRLQPSDAAQIAGSAAENSYTMNMANFQAFARGNGDLSLAGMYTGLANAAASEAAMSTALAVTDHVRLRQRALAQARNAAADAAAECALPAVILNSDHANRIWAGGFGFIEEAVARTGVPGYRYAPAGFITGYDYAMQDFSAGMTYSYAKGSFADKSALRHDSTISSHTIGVHGSYFHPSGLFAGVMGGYTFSDNDIAELRQDPSAAGNSWNRAEYHGSTWHGALEVGYEARPNECFTITPTIGFTYVHTTSRNHEELLGGIAAGRVRGVRNQAAYLPVRLEAGYEVAAGAESSFRFTVSGGYAYNFSDDEVQGVFDPDGFANAFSHKVVGRDPGHHNYNAGAGMRFVTDRFDIGFNYDFFYKKDYQAHRLMAAAGFSF